MRILISEPGPPPVTPRPLASRVGGLVARWQSRQITIMSVRRAWEFDLLIIGPQRDSSPNIFAPSPRRNFLRPRPL